MPLNAIKQPVKTNKVAALTMDRLVCRWCPLLSIMGAQRQKSVLAMKLLMLLLLLTVDVLCTYEPLMNKNMLLVEFRTRLQTSFALFCELITRHLIQLRLILDRNWPEPCGITTAADS